MKRLLLVLLLGGCVKHGTPQCNAEAQMWLNAYAECERSPTCTLSIPERQKKRYLEREFTGCKVND